jgi:2-methylisocitrate lyase-like PEP mutase family enzyme
MPGCADALGATLIARSGEFECAFMSGYGVSATRLGDPDVGLATLADVVDAGTAVCRAAGPGVAMVGDGDAGFGSFANVRRTVESFHRAGFAAVSIEDQVFPKRCAFAGGVRVVSRREALSRVRAALDARDDIRARGGDVLIVARTDARLARQDDFEDSASAFEEAMWRCAAFEDMGADVVYFEGPDGVAEMETFAKTRVRRSTPKMLAQVEKPGREILTAEQCADLGFDAVLYGLTLLSASAAGMERALRAMGRGGTHPTPGRRARDLDPSDVGDGALMPFDHLYDVVGFPKHFEMEARYDPEKFRV